MLDLSLLYGRNQHNIVNIKKTKKKEKSLCQFSHTVQEALFTEILCKSMAFEVKLLKFEVQRLGHSANVAGLTTRRPHFKNHLAIRGSYFSNSA